MKDDLVRFGIAMESGLLKQLDALAAARGSNRSELLRDLTRAELSRLRVDHQAPAFAAVTLVYNHHVRELAERLTSLQHDLGDQVRSTMHVHLNHDHCLEVVVMRGPADRLRSTADRMLGTRGVLHGGAEYVAESMLSTANGAQRSRHHEHDHSGHGDDAPVESNAPRKVKRSRAATTSRRSRARRPR